MVDDPGEVEARQPVGLGGGQQPAADRLGEVARRLVLEVVERDLLEVDLALVDRDRGDLGRAAGLGQLDQQHVPRACLGGVEAEAFGRAGVGGGDRAPSDDPRPVVIAKGQVVEAAAVEVGLLEGQVLGIDLAGDIGPEHRRVRDADLEASAGIRTGQPAEEAARPRPAERGEAVEGGVADDHGAPAVLVEDGDVGRPGPVPDATRPPGVVGARRDQHGDAAGSQGGGQPRGLGLAGKVAVEDIAGQDDRVDPVLADELGKAIDLAREIFASLRPTTAVLDVLEAWRQVDVRAVEDPHDE